MPSLNRVYTSCVATLLSMTPKENPVKHVHGRMYEKLISMRIQTGIWLCFFGVCV